MYIHYEVKINLWRSSLMNKSLLLIAILPLVSCGDKGLEKIKSMSGPVKNVASAVKERVADKVIDAKNRINNKIEEANAEFDRALKEAADKINSEAENIRKNQNNTNDQNNKNDQNIEDK